MVVGIVAVIIGCSLQLASAAFVDQIMLILGGRLRRPVMAAMGAMAATLVAPACGGAELPLLVVLMRRNVLRLQRLIVLALLRGGSRRRGMPVVGGRRSARSVVGEIVASRRRRADSNSLRGLFRSAGLRLQHVP